MHMPKGCPFCGALGGVARFARYARCHALQKAKRPAASWAPVLVKLQPGREGRRCEVIGSFWKLAMGWGRVSKANMGHWSVRRVSISQEPMSLTKPATSNHSNHGPMYGFAIVAGESSSALPGSMCLITSCYFTLGFSLLLHSMDCRFAEAVAWVRVILRAASCAQGQHVFFFLFFFV